MDPQSHYYGDLVRRLFLAAGIALSLAFPLFSRFIPVPPLISLSAVVALIFLAGYTSPGRARVAALDVAASALAIVTFGFHAFIVWTGGGRTWDAILFFLILLGLVTLFIFALYYSVKSLRGMRA